jgi:exopolysaccharide biosynthesis operon protein EpsL
MLPRSRLPAAALPWLPILLLIVSNQSLAFFNDQLKLVYSEQLSHDSNVFRISSGRDPVSAINSSATDDTLRTTRLGIALDLPVSRQRFQAAFNRSNVRNRRFTDRDFDGHDERAAWLWQLGNNWSGQIGRSETLALAGTANTPSRVANPLTAKQTFANASYLLGANVRVQGGLTQSETRNGDSARRASDTDGSSVDFSLAYINAAANSIGISLRRDDTRFPNREIVASSAIDNRSKQQSVGAFAEWQVTGHSRLTARADRVNKTYSQLSQRDFEGTTYRISHNWSPTAKTGLSTSVFRDVSPLEDVATSFVLGTGVSLRPSWAVTTKLSLGGVLDYTMRDYRGESSVALGLTPKRDETTRSVGLNAQYVPARFMSMGANFTHEQRSSSIVFGDYSVKLFSLSVQFAF